MSTMLDGAVYADDSEIFELQAGHIVVFGTSSWVSIVSLT